MKTSLTPFMLSFLIEQGYKFMVSKISTAGTEVLITLTPITQKPTVGFAEEGETYFEINKEPRAMAEGVAGTIFLVHLTQKDIELLKEKIISGDAGTDEEMCVYRIKKQG